MAWRKQKEPDGGKPVTKAGSTESDVKSTSGDKTSDKVVEKNMLNNSTALNNSATNKTTNINSTSILNSFVTKNKLQAAIPGKKNAPPPGWKLLLNFAFKTLQKGMIPLLLAVEAGNQSMSRELLSQQTVDQLNATTDNGDTALHLAARRRDVDTVRIIIGNGANLDCQNSEGQTALHIASAEGDETLVKYFYGVQASASIIDNQDRTPMHLAAENGHASIIKLLADKFKASIFERTKDGSTLMHIASLNGHADCVMMLFKKGVYLHMPNKAGVHKIPRPKNFPRTQT